MTAGFLLSALSVKTTWRQIWEPSDVLEGESLQNQARVRIAKAVATVAYQYGIVQSLFMPQGKPRPKILPQAKHQQSASVATVEHESESYGESVAVVVPVLVLDGEHLTKLRRTIGAIRAQSILLLRVFLVDDGSPIPISEQLTRQEVRGLTILRTESNQGPAAARNRGLKAAREAGVDYVCFTDADCVPEPSWVEAMVQHFRKNASDDVLGGVTQSLNQATTVDLFHDVFGTLNGRMLPDKTLLYAPTCNMGIRMRSVDVGFRSVFPEAAFEDIDFCIQARKSGATLKPVNDALVLHDYDSSLPGLFRQFARYGRSCHRMLKMHPYYLNWLARTKSIPVKRLFAI